MTVYLIGHIDIIDRDTYAESGSPTGPAPWHGIDPTRIKIWPQFDGEPVPASSA